MTSVFEFRNKDWYVPETYALFERYGASFCVHDMPGSKAERIAVGRSPMSGSTAAKGNIGAATPMKGCSTWTDWILEQSRRGRTVWCYFNNDIHGHAIHDAQTLKSMVRQVIRATGEQS